MRYKSWFLALRPKTLTAAIVPVVVATALVHHQGFPVQWWISICALFSAILIQIGTNLANDAIDFAKGADTHTRIGPQRVTQAGFLTSKQVMFGAGVSFALALLLGVPLVWQGGWPIVFIGLVSIGLGYGYTGGPWPLAYIGLGDLFVILFFGLIAVMGTFFLHTGQINIEAAVAGLQVGLLAAVLIAINNIRDAPEDAKVHKKTLPVRFGLQFARIEVVLLSTLPFALCYYWKTHGAFNAALLPFIGLPLLRRVIAGVFMNKPGPIYNRLLAISAGLQMLFGVGLSVGLWMR